MNQRTNYTSGAPWEDKVGYCRAVRKGNIIEVSGTTAVQDGQIVFIGDAGGQTKHILQIIKEAIEQLGGKMSDVVRTRAYVIDISDFEKVGTAHSEYFKEIKPAMTLVEVSGLVDDRMLVEIEATAILDV